MAAGVSIALGFRFKYSTEISLTFVKLRFVLDAENTWIAGSGLTQAVKDEEVFHIPAL